MLKCSSSGDEKDEAVHILPPFSWIVRDMKTARLVLLCIPID